MKIPKQEYTAEFKEQAVKRAHEVGAGSPAREPGLVAQTLRNWVKVSVSARGYRAWRGGGSPTSTRPNDV